MEGSYDVYTGYHTNCGCWLWAVSRDSRSHQVELAPCRPCVSLMTRKTMRPLDQHQQVRGVEDVDRCTHIPVQCSTAWTSSIRLPLLVIVLTLALSCLPPFSLFSSIPPAALGRSTPACVLLW